MADLITRQAAIDVLDRNRILGQGLLNDTLDHIADVIMALPSAQLETHDKRTETHSCDCISRQAAIEALKEAFNPSIVNFVKAKIAIENLPSAQPEKRTDKCTEMHACDYERAVEQLEHDMLYEPTFNQDDGSM